MKIRKRRISRWIFATCFVFLTVILVWEIIGAPQREESSTWTVAVLWGICGGLFIHAMRKNSMKGFDCVYRCFREEDLKHQLAKENFKKISKYLWASKHWIILFGQYVPKNFVIGAYAMNSIDQSDTLHLALITGNTCHGLIYEKDTLELIDQLAELLPHGDIKYGGARFISWWSENRERLARQMEWWEKEGRDFWSLVYRWQNLSGWEVRRDDAIDDSEEYFREYPEERQKEWMN